MAQDVSHGRHDRLGVGRAGGNVRLGDDPNFTGRQPEAQASVGFLQQQPVQGLSVSEGQAHRGIAFSDAGAGLEQGFQKVFRRGALADALKNRARLLPFAAGIVATAALPLDGTLEKAASFFRVSAGQQ